jgi:serine/threonine protein kinase
LYSDLYGGGDLLDYIMAKGKFSEPRCRKLFKDITRAVAYLHKNGIAHRDLKGENVLLRFNEKVPYLVNNKCVNFYSGKTRQGGYY